MGRETVATARWRGDVAETRVLLEAQEIILRGAIKARIPRAAISAITIEEDDLVVLVDADRLVIELGAAQAAKWHDALLKPPPSLASKLGIGTDHPVFVIGGVQDDALNDALAGATCPTPGQAHILLSVVNGETDLRAALAIAIEHPTMFLWCIYAKGKGVTFGDSSVRALMRDAGYVDSKSCAVSVELTGTRYGRRT